mgnify:FL=1
MLVNWHPGEEVQVDWAGRKLSLYGAGEEVTPVSLFVATLPYSDKTFVRASLEMGMQSWLEHHKAMFAYFGGAPLFQCHVLGSLFPKPCNGSGVR